jgi:hypothetical protein
MKNAVFWDFTRRGSCKNSRFRGMYRLHHQGDIRSVFRLLVTANVRSSPIVTLMMQAILFQETHGVKSEKTAFFKRFPIQWLLRALCEPAAFSSDPI